MGLTYCEASGKICFRTRAAAYLRARKIGKRMRAYRCAACHLFHLTSAH